LYIYPVIKKRRMKLTNMRTDRTSFYDVTILATPSELRAAIGEPQFEENTGRDKVNMEWSCETSDCRAVTIYDWKERRKLGENQRVEWHIGGRNKIDCQCALEELMDALSKV
jgi:hypothetical protein